jgi:hypothetical protein
MEDFKQKQVAYGAQHADAFITYSDKARGYSLKYPIGYQITKDDELGSNASVRIWADSPFSAGEIFTVRVFDGSFTEKDFAEALTQVQADSSSPVNTVTYNYSGSIDGRKGYLFTVEQYVDAVNEIVYSKNAIYPDCKTPDGKTYSALLTFAVPEALSEDQDLADYVLYSFKC